MGEPKITKEEMQEKLKKAFGVLCELNSIIKEDTKICKHMEASMLEKEDDINLVNKDIADLLSRHYKLLEAANKRKSIDDSTKKQLDEVFKQLEDCVNKLRVKLKKITIKRDRANGHISNMQKQLDDFNKAYSDLVEHITRYAELIKSMG